MGSKRKFSEFHAESSGNAEARGHNSGSHGPKRSNHKKAKTNPNNINWVKKRARTIERRFKTGQNMPANIQNDLERELAHHQQKIEDAADEKKRKAMITKYHMVRFFERKKADRLAKKIKSQLKTATDEKEIEKLNADLHRAEIDSIYTRYFPYRERYVSLYPVTAQGEKKEDASSAAQALHDERPPLWAAIEEASAKGVRELIILRERKLDGDSRKKTSTTQKLKESESANTSHAKTKNFATSKSTNTRRGEEKKYGDEPEPLDASDSDGGFFEEG
ncbi:uncharacterized protein GGS22DRAFT_33552 [Annulohypoxylon maeteangense]|uniref:uncharacterized protein n=1 Tax=Annulohypoxylon maeteangense TaxID=1927788 RepID=UPI0020072E34|nr:uncharacterized protein GGS22DRAFT_33552 [Annulohypoxylon maeteangense]KAI0883598.1 hypothetical protein GGS22DRAFT_33552 [Annulohypoxylon maeteangense]